MVALTQHDRLLSLLGEWVTVTHPGDEHRTWHGQLASLMDSPSLVLRMPEGGIEVLPQCFHIEPAEAPPPGAPHPGDHARPFTALADSGLLWLFNRLVLHPRGLALALHIDPKGHAYGWSLIRSPDGEPWQFDPATDADGRARAEATLAAELADTPGQRRCAVCSGTPALWETEDGRPFCAGCVSCTCDRPDCVFTTTPDSTPDTPSARPDTPSGEAVRTGTDPENPADREPLPTSPDTPSGHPDAPSGEAVRTGTDTDADIIRDVRPIRFDVARTLPDGTHAIFAVDTTPLLAPLPPDTPEAARIRAALRNTIAEAFDLTPDTTTAAEAAMPCHRGDCTAARADLALAAGTYDRLRENITALNTYIRHQQQTGPLRGGDTRKRVLTQAAAWATDPGPLTLNTHP